MRIVYFASGGDIGFFPLRQLVQQHEIVAVVRPHPQSLSPRPWYIALARRLVRRQVDPISQLARHQHIPTFLARPGHDSALIGSLARLRPELGCLATFPWLLSPTIYTLPIYGTVNLHSSLLPRHRGPTPLFWLYYHNDRHTGVTVHEVNARADAGAILAQDSFPLPRGYSVTRLHSDTAHRGATLMLEVVEAFEKGSVKRFPQDESRATRAPRVPPGSRMVAFASWDVERVWHFLAGLFPQFYEPLTDQDGSLIRYSSVLGYRPQAHTQPPGSVLCTAHGWRLYCQGGWVHLGQHRPELAPRL
ncbi:MAG: methionyl-tRNA formyltransferase [Candidatus Tectimicrobiota bacterium]